MKTSPLKKAIITASVLFFISLALSGCASTNARTALRDLQEEGFTDIHVFPTKEDLRPKLFVDKYTFVEIGVDTINSVKILTGEICFRNVITGERKTILPIPEWNRMKSVCYIYSLENNELFFSVVNENLFTVYKYNVKDETLEPIRYINLENKYCIIQGIISSL